MMKLASHIHTFYSPDCESDIESIINRLISKNFEACIITDHDIFGLTPEEESYFKDAGIRLYRGIEFTCKEGVHIIGVAENIKELEKPPFFYDALTLLKKLKLVGAKIIIPHPDHITGVFGGRLNNNVALQILKLADYVETRSFKYGSSKSYDGIREIGGDDAHYSCDIGNVINIVDSEGFLKVIDVKITLKFVARKFMLAFIASRIWDKLRGFIIIKKSIKYVKIFIKKTGVDSSL